MNVQTQSLSNFSDNFVKGLYSPLSLLAKLTGTGAYTSAATTIKGFYIVGAVVKAADYSTLLFSYPLQRGFTYDFKQGFINLANLISENKGLSPNIKQLRSNLQTLGRYIDNCPTSLLMISMAGEAAAANAKKSAKSAIESAIYFLDGLSGSTDTLSYRIIFNSYRDGNPEIYIMDADGSNQRNLSGNMFDVWLTFG